LCHAAAQAAVHCCSAGAFASLLCGTFNMNKLTGRL
jgi:hypothetical protein